MKFLIEPIQRMVQKRHLKDQDIEINVQWRQNPYGVGEEGWRNFVNRNYLNPFVNEAYEVKDLFAPLSVYKDTMCCELVGTYHDFDWCLPRCDRNFGTVQLNIAKERMVNFIRNSLWIWDRRADIIASS